MEHFAISLVGAWNLEETIMRALCWHGKGDVRVDTVQDPKIQHPLKMPYKIHRARPVANTTRVFNDKSSVDPAGSAFFTYGM